MKRRFVEISLLSLILWGCGDSTVSYQTETGVYKEILSLSVQEYDISLLVNGADSLTTGYNEIFFSVKRNSAALNSGHVKFFPKMWMTSTYAHSTPVSPRFNYDNSSGFYRGYIIFNMPTSPPLVVWNGFITYVDSLGINHAADSVPMYVSLHLEKQWRLFYDSTDQTTWVLSLLKPFSPVKGMNDIHIMLHKTDALLYDFLQIDNAEMFIDVYKADSTVHSQGNISPVGGSDGVYRGRINLPYNGNWIVSDTIKYNGNYITNKPPPLPTFYFVIQ